MHETWLSEIFERWIIADIISQLNIIPWTVRGLALLVVLTGVLGCC